jgi:hypothetical protein
MKAKSSFEISEEVTGLTIRHGNGRTNRSDRRIVCLDTSSCFADITQVIPGHFKKPPATAEALNSGIHGHIYAQPSDFLVVRLHDGTGSDADRLTHHLLNLNAEIWHSQTGISLLTPSSGVVSYVAKDETMLETAVNLFKRGTARTLIASSVTPRLVNMLKAENTELDQIARSCDLLNHKNSCLPMLQALGVRVPWTMTINQHLQDVAAVLDLVHELTNGYRYVLKADGSSGGVGVYTNGVAGYDASSLCQLMLDMLAQRRLPSRFQIQEFVPGTPMGALGIFDGRGHFRLLSVHVQGVSDGVFRSGHWRRSIHDQLGPQVREVYERIAGAPNLHPKGPLGIDFKVTGSGISVLEVNARLTGSGPIAWLLSRPAIHDLCSSRSSSGNDLDSIDLVDIELGPRDLGGGKLLDAITSILGEPAVRSACRGLPMILPQGLDPYRPSKVMFINDTDGRLKRAFYAVFPQTEPSLESESYVTV